MLLVVEKDYSEKILLPWNDCNALFKNIGDDGSVVVYNQTFENMILNQLKDDIEDDIEDLIEESNFDENLYIQKSMEIKKKATILEAKRIKKILEILNEEQRDEFADHFKEWIIE